MTKPCRNQFEATVLSFSQERLLYCTKFLYQLSQYAIFVHNFLLVLIDKNNVTKAKSHNLIFEPRSTTHLQSNFMIYTWRG